MTEPHIEPTFAPLVLACAKFGIGRTTAFQLVASGDLETFLIGTRRYVILESLHTLPQRRRQAQTA